MSPILPTRPKLRLPDEREPRVNPLVWIPLVILLVVLSSLIAIEIKGDPETFHPSPECPPLEIRQIKAHLDQTGHVEPEAKAKLEEWNRANPGKLEAWETYENR